VPPPLPALKLPLPPRRLGPGAIIAIVVHVLVIGAVLWERSAYLRDTIGGAGPRGGGGTGGTTVRYFAVARPPAAPATAPVTPPVEVTPAPISIPDLKLQLQPVAIAPQPVTIGTVSGPGGESAGSGGGSGGGQGPGTGSSTGPGTGGDGGYIVPPTVTGLIVPPVCARGQFAVRFSVDARGRVDAVNVDPPPKDGECRKEFLARMRGYKFEPGKAADGRPVAAVTTITITR
jgi:hypothetical protein